MSGRKTPLVTGEYYHVFNHGIDYRDICTSKREYERLLLTLWFYQPEVVQVKLSHYLVLPSDARQQLLAEINQKPKIVEIHAFSVMPNHYHLVVKQCVDKGISTFIGNVQNSFSKYYNTKHERHGSLFLSPFQATHIHNESQFLHVTRYVHLNRYSSGIISDVEMLRSDPYTSTSFYFDSPANLHSIVKTDFLASMFDTPSKHWEFIANHADYQRSLEHIKHLINE